MLNNKIKEDRIVALKGGQKNKAKFLATLLGEVETEVKRGVELTDGLVISKIKKTLKGLDEMLKIEPKATLLLQEKAILQEYLPEMMSTNDIVAQVKVYVEQNEGAKLGEVMKYFKENFEGTYDPKEVSSYTKTVCK